MKALKSFEDIEFWTDHQIRRIFGGRILGLYQAYTLNLPIVETWLLSSENLDTFLTQNPEIDHFKKQSTQFLDLLLSEDLNELPDTLFAVRSSSQFENSGDMSFAGIFESKLHVSKANISKAVSEVWDSCHSFRATYYSKKESEIRMSVIIQPMIAAKYAGVCFSKNPSPHSVLENSDIIVEFAPTSGDKVVQGEITPLRFSGNIQNLISTVDIPWMEPLLKNLFVLKDHYNHEVDMEFVIDERDNFWLLQQRPISAQHASRHLDLTHYKRHCKRSLLNLDIELLIEGCSQFLAPYLEIPYQLDRWMIMTQADDGLQELWLHEILNDAIVHQLIQKIQKEPEFLERIESRYQIHFEKIINHGYQAFFNPEIPLKTRFFQWYEFIKPLQAHYYAPILMIEALHQFLKKNMLEKDPGNSDADLFLLGTFGIQTLSDQLKEALLLLRKEKPSSKKLHSSISLLSKKYGFLKCLQPYEPAYNIEEIEKMYGQIEKPSRCEDPQKKHPIEALIEKYFQDPHLFNVYRHFRNWMSIYNQDREYLKYAYHASRTLFEEISSLLGVSIQQLWSVSKILIIHAIKEKSPRLIDSFKNAQSVIYRSAGKTHVASQLKILKPEVLKNHILGGKTVFGAGILTLKVRKIFKPAEFAQLPPFDKNNAEVLVTGMTTPDFIPYLKQNFAAFITDEGGILCHAAILAREIGIPCIIGTGLATEILHNGDWITLDFDRAEIYTQMN